MEKTLKVFLQFIGVWNKKGRESLLRILFGFNLLLLSLICLMSFRLRNVVFVSLSNELVTNIMYVSDIGLFAIPAATHLTILVETFLKRQKLAKLLKMLNGLQHKSTSLSKHVKLGIFCFFLCTAIEFSIMSTAIYYKINWVYHWYVTEYSFIICHIETLVHIYFVTLLRKSLEAVNDRLCSIRKQIIFGSAHQFPSKLNKKIFKIYENLVVCFKANDMLNKCFEWSVLANSLHYFITLAFDTFFFGKAIGYFIRSGNLYFIGKSC